MSLTFWVCFSINKIIGDKESRNDFEKFWRYHQAAAKSKVCSEEARNLVWDSVEETHHTVDLLKEAKDFVFALDKNIHKEIIEDSKSIKIVLEMYINV